jgi:hypothetical protein
VDRGAAMTSCFFMPRLSLHIFEALHCLRCVVDRLPPWLGRAAYATVNAVSFPDLVPVWQTHSI